MSSTSNAVTGNLLDVSQIANQYIPGFHREWSLFGGAFLVFACGRPTNYAHIDENHEAQKVIGELAAACGVKKILAPSVKKTNALILAENQIRHVELQHWNKIEAYIGGDVDGVRLMEPGSAFFLASADCPTCIVRLPDKTVVAMHAGIRSLVQWGDPEALDPTRQYESVIEAALDDFDPEVHLATRTAAALLCGISSEHFLYPRDHPKYGSSNSQLIARLMEKHGVKSVDGNAEEGRINLREIVRDQLRRRGVRVQDPDTFVTDDICTFSNRSQIGGANEFMWHSHARFFQEGDIDSEQDGRNGIFVVRIS